VLEHDKFWDHRKGGNKSVKHGVCDSHFHLQKKLLFRFFI
jgi:hypothetical protein